MRREEKPRAGGGEYSHEKKKERNLRANARAKKSNLTRTALYTQPL